MSKHCIRAVVVDDEPHCRSALVKQLEWSCPHVEVVGVGANAKEGLHQISQSRPDLVFLDVEMPDKNGFDLLHSLDNIDFEVIFTTAYDDFALEAFKVKAIDYLVKPIEEESLVEAVDRASIFIHNQSVNDSIIKPQSDHTSVDQKIAFPVSNGIKFIMLSSIIRCQAEGSYSRIYYGDQQQLFIAKTLKTITDLCQSSRLLRVHQSHLINADHIDQYIKSDGGQIIMSDGSNIPIARRRKEDWINWLR